MVKHTKSDGIVYPDGFSNHNNDNNNNTRNCNHFTAATHVKGWRPTPPSGAAIGGRTVGGGEYATSTSSYVTSAPAPEQEKRTAPAADAGCGRADALLPPPPL